MKICYAVCEYNPFHYGHLKHLDYINDELFPDAVAVIMSGNFTQRGEAAIEDKYTRAIHAIKGGADIVIELPAVFATASAEIFAKGALKLVNAAVGEKTLCFGAETDDLPSLVRTAEFLIKEPPEFKTALKEELAKGVTFPKARCVALEKTGYGAESSLLKTPNNVLAAEYIKAIISGGYDINVKSLKRSGDYNDKDLKKDYSSALAVRESIKNGKIKSAKEAVPDFARGDLPEILPDFDAITLYSLITAAKEDLRALPDCNEGLENKIKAALKNSFTAYDLISRLKSKRYVETRLKRVLLSSVLGIKKDLVSRSLSDDLYLKILAVNKDKKWLLSEFSNAKYPLITRKSDINSLGGTALETFMKDVEAQEIYSAVTKKRLNEFETVMVCR